MGERACNPNLIVPAGTEVVARVPVHTIGAAQTLPQGAVGVVVQSPTDNQHSYRVRFPDGAEAMLTRQEIAVLKHVQRWGLERVGGVLEDYNLYDYVIYQCVLGSRAYGLAGDDSDTTCAASICRPRSCTGRCTACRGSWRTSKPRRPTGNCRSS